MAVSNSLAAIEGGARRIEGTVNVQLQLNYLKQPFLNRHGNEHYK
jgi:hypothetical protein